MDNAIALGTEMLLHFFTGLRKCASPHGRIHKGWAVEVPAGGEGLGLKGAGRELMSCQFVAGQVQYDRAPRLQMGYQR
jgi:hypothetical protein